MKPRMMYISARCDFWRRRDWGEHRDAACWRQGGPAACRDTRLHVRVDLDRLARVDRQAIGERVAGISSSAMLPVIMVYASVLPSYADGEIGDHAETERVGAGGCSDTPGPRMSGLVTLSTILVAGPERRQRESSGAEARRACALRAGKHEGRRVVFEMKVMGVRLRS